MLWIFLCTVLEEKRSQSILFLKKIWSTQEYTWQNTEYGCLLGEDRNIQRKNHFMYFTLLGKNVFTGICAIKMKQQKRYITLPFI